MANYKRKTYPVTIQLQQEHGTLTGAAANGIYYYGDTLRLTAVPDPDYVFWNWTVNGNGRWEPGTYTFVVSGSMDISAVFLPYDPDAVQTVEGAPTAPRGIYTITGVYVGSEADRNLMRRLPKGIYILVAKLRRCSGNGSRG